MDTALQAHRFDLCQIDNGLSLPDAASAFGLRETPDP